MIPKHLYIHNPVWPFQLPSSLVAEVWLFWRLHTGHRGSENALHLPEVPQLEKAEGKDAWL